MEAKRRQQQQQQQLCVQALHPQQMGAPCGAPLGYPASPWVLWDAGQLMEAAARKRKKKRRLYAACLLAGVAVVVLAVAGVAGLAVYLGGSPPTESSANWESFRRAGEARYGEEPTTHRVLGRHGVLVRADPPTERTTPPARSPWSIRREESLSRWEGRGQGGGDGGTPGAISRADRVEEAATAEEEEVEADEGFGEVGGEDYSEGVPEVEVVLENGEVEPVGDGSEAVESVEGNPGHRSPHARASDAAKAATAAGGGTGASGPVAAPAGGEGEEAARVPTTLVEYVTTISVVESPVRSAAVDSGVLRRNERRKGEGAKYAGASSGGGGGEDAAEEEDESVEGVVEEEESRRGGEERRYEQLQVSNKAASGGVPVFNILTKILNRVNGSSGIKELENAEKKHADNGTMECTAGEFRCAVPNGGIMCLPGSSRCDGARDCFLNGEDEIGCTCADTLRSRFLHRKLCDGVPDCWDYSDEDQCEWCSPGHLVCGGGARSCVEPERICDGVKDCPGGDDESRCIALSPEEIHKEPKMMGSDGRRFYHRGSNWNGTTRGSDYVTASMVTNEVLPYRSSGYLLVRKKGVWGKLCVDSSANDGVKNLKGAKEKSWGVADIGHEVCKAMTHRDFELIEQVTDGDLLEGSHAGPPKTPYYELQSSSSQNDILGSTQSLQSTECSSKKVMRVMCRDLECGVRPKIKVNQWSRIVGGGNAAPGAWPWQAALYREGEFQCGATLISDHWLISAGHCFFRAPDDYWVARLGTLRRGTALPSPHEQRRPVSSIILHPRYVDEGFLNDIALLRLSLPVEITDHVRPICLPPRAAHIPISSYHNPERVTNPTSEERDPVQITTEEGISYLYDEAISTFPSVVNSHDGSQVDFTTESPHSLHDVDEYPPTTEYNDQGFLHLSSHHEIESMESMHSTKDGLPTSGYSNVKDVESTNSNKFKLHISQPNRNDGKIEHEPSEMLTLTHFGDIDHLDSERLSSSGNITSMTESYEYEINENETTHDYITEPITNQATSLISQYIGTQSVTEEIDLKDLIREVSSLFLSTNSRPLQNSAAPNSMNTIHISDIKVKNGIGDANIDESTKSTSMHSHPGISYLSENIPTKPLNSSTKIVPVDLVSPTSSETIESTSGDQSSEFQVRNLSDSEQIKNRYFIGHPTSHKELESNDSTTPTILKLEQAHDKYSNHIKNPHETPNILFLSDKFVENKHANRTASTVSPDDGGEGSQVGKQSSVRPATAAIIEEMAKSIVEAIGDEGRERKTRNVVRSRQGDDGGDDGIRNGRLCTVVGWGQLFEVGKIFPDTLQEVELPLISTAECRKRTVFLPLYHLTDAMFCAGYDNGGRDACLGDSGGPLMCQEPDGHWSLYGVTSNGYGCARVNRPGVYTKVSHYIPWMEEAMAKEDSALEEKRKRDEERWREEVGGEEGWRERWEWRRRRLEEQGMGKHHCPHRCPLGECLQKARVCNGVVDCSDASDEQNCHGDLRVGR